MKRIQISFNTISIIALLALTVGCATTATFPQDKANMTAASPGIVAAAMENRHYPNREDYVRAVAAALRTEYRAIVERGLLLQIDAPDLAMTKLR